MFLRFYNYREHWSNAISCIAELDVLCSLAIVSHGKLMSRPVVTEKLDQGSYTDIKKMVHPCFEMIQVSRSLDFVANDIFIGPN